MTMDDSDAVVARMADLMAACAAVAAFRHGDRDGVHEALQAVGPGRSGEALLALGTVLVDQVARATAQPWESVLNAVMKALMDPDERELAHLAVQLERPTGEPGDG